LFKLVSKIRHSDHTRAAKWIADAVKSSKSETAAGWRLRVLDAELLLDDSDDTGVPKLLSSPIPSDIPPREAAARVASVKGYMAQDKSDWKRAGPLYDAAYAEISSVDDDPCWKAELLVHHQAQTLIHLNEWDSFAGLLKRAAPETQACPDKYWEALAPVVEGNLYLAQSYYEKAINSFQTGINLATSNNLSSMISIPLGNVGLCYFNLGDYDQALVTFDKTDDDPTGWVTGHRARAYLALRKYDQAAHGYQAAIQIAAKTNSPKSQKYLTRWRAELTSLYIETHDYQSAELLNQQVLKEANTDDFPVLEAAWLNAARLARLRGNPRQAQETLDKIQRALQHDPKHHQRELIWQLHGERALNLSSLNRTEQARREFDAALGTAEAARESIGADQYRLTYFLPLLALYQNYIKFLAQRDLPIEALRVAELGHARLLADKLHTSPNQRGNYDFTSLARTKQAVVLSYATAPGRSYMWVTTSRFSKMFTLPPEDELAKLVKRHNDPILEERSLAEDSGGRDLYTTLIGQAAQLIPPHSNVIVIPDGPLSDLNFETLIPPGPKAEYWLNSVTATVAPSLTLLLAQEQRGIHPRSVFAIGGAVQEHPGLPQLGDQEVRVLQSIYGPRCHFLIGVDATPTGFIRAQRDPSSIIHISAHAIPNPQSPLDSYVVLSPEANNEYRLYARDLAKLRLKADLVTLSACQSAAAKNVPGEGLVGLAWAVLSAGAHNVVASLWPVSAPATAELMKRFYTHLDAGESPAQALHSAKVELSGRPGSIPYEWAAFQLYSR
jgi:CHAT domain-containing protein